MTYFNKQFRVMLSNSRLMTATTLSIIAMFSSCTLNICTFSTLYTWLNEGTVQREGIGPSHGNFNSSS